MNKNGQNLSLLWLFCDQKAKKPTAFGAANTYIKENPQLIGFIFLKFRLHRIEFSTSTFLSVSPNTLFRPCHC